jgi:hypothetical protein
MKNVNSFNRNKERLLSRWMEEDYPGGTPRFQLALLAKDVAIFCLVPLAAIVIFKIVESSLSAPARQPERRRAESNFDRPEKHSQIISFNGRVGAGGSPYSKRAPGTLVKVRLMNVIETLTNAPVHAQVVDYGLGKEFIGGTLIGDATGDPMSGRVNITFRFVRHPRRADLAVPLSARAMSLDGTFGISASKKEGFFARAAIRSASNNPNSVDAGADKEDMRTLLARALAAGMMQEFQSEASVAHNNAQVMTVKPMTEFFVELTDYFPGQQQ